MKVIKKETPVERLMRQSEEQSAENLLAHAKINIHFTKEGGSNMVVIRKIIEALAYKLPFGLKCQRSQVIFIPTKLKAYWMWGDGTSGPVFTYKSDEDLINGVGMQYMVHKDFMPTAEVEAMAKIILYEQAIDNLASWRQNNVPEPGKPSR